MAPLTRKKKRLHRESLYILPSYCQAYIFSHFESTTELLMYSTVCKRCEDTTLLSYTIATEYIYC